MCCAPELGCYETYTNQIIQHLLELEINVQAYSVMNFLHSAIAFLYEEVMSRSWMASMRTSVWSTERSVARHLGYVR